MARVSRDTKYQRDIIKALNNFSNSIIKMMERRAKILEGELQFIADSVIDDFYADYTPSSYQRYGDMYNAYKISVDLNRYDVTYDVIFSSEYMQYHEGLQSYIYEIVFEEGWHGGADDGEGHPEPGIPWYRNMRAIKDAGENYHSFDPASFWLRRAERSKTRPLEEIEKRIKKYIPKWEKENEDEFDVYAEKFINDLKVIIEQRNRRR